LPPFRPVNVPKERQWLAAGRPRRLAALDEVGILLVKSGGNAGQLPAPPEADSG
jgi:hypothetical protein